MKQSQIILFAVFLVISGLIYVGLSRNKKEEEKTMKSEKKMTYVAVSSVNNQTRTSNMTSYGQVTPNVELMIAFEVQGKLEKGNVTMKPGVNFSKGQLLYTLDRTEATYSINARISVLSNLLINALPDIELDFPKERSKWIKFYNDLDPLKRLPDFPRFTTDKEQRFISSRNIVSEYYTLKSQEVRLDKYMYFAPFSGTVISVYSEPGSIINPGAQIAKVAQTGGLEIKVPIAIESLNLYKEKSSATFTNAKGEKVATGKIVRISDVINQQTQAADVYYSLTPLNGTRLYNGMFLNAMIERKVTTNVMTLPVTAVKDGMVQQLTGGKLSSKSVTILESKPDSVFVSGLTNGQLIVLDHIEAIEKGMTYKGVKR